MSFAAFNFQPAIEAGIKHCGFTSPTLIQQQAIPAVLAGRDLMGLAQTGTGKTAAFLLPVIQRLSSGPRRQIRALVVAPTRELAEQTDEAFRLLAGRTGLRSVTIYGGVSKDGQLRRLRAGAEVVIACPGRLLDHLGAGDCRLDKVETLVLDEADQMFDMGFLPDIRRILTHLPGKRQTLLFSATMPADIRRLAGEILQRPVLVRPDAEQPPSTIVQALYEVEPPRKAALLLDLLRDSGGEATLVFTRTKYGARSLAKRLAKAGLRAADLQGNLSQTQRRKALDGFRNGTFSILVATDIAARGIDVDRISHVINYDMPATAEAYTHRVGRTGRASRTGEAFSLVGREDLPLVGAIERSLGRRIERRTLAGFDYRVPAANTAGYASRPATGEAPTRARATCDARTGYGCRQARTSRGTRGDRSRQRVPGTRH